MFLMKIGNPGRNLTRKLVAEKIPSQSGHMEINAIVLPKNFNNVEIYQGNHGR